MTVDIKVPSVGESITTGTLASWRKASGDVVQEGEMIFELETDKSLLEIPSPASGVLVILVEADMDVTIGQVVGQLSPNEGKDAIAPAVVTDPASVPAKKPITPLSPAVRKVVADHGLDPASIDGTGKDGRITKADALRVAMAVEASKTEAIPNTPTPPATTPVPAPSQPQSSVSGARNVKRVPMSRLRKKTAQRLVQAKQDTAYLTTFNEIDMQAIVDIRTRHKTGFEKDHGIKIGFMSFFVKACCQALKAFPAVNAQIDGSDILYHDYYDIGVAVSINEGLIVPVIRDADRQSFAEIETTIGVLAERARQKQLLPDELTGGTFSITNGGVFGSLMSTPIPAYPQTAILGMHSIKQRPVVIEGQIVARPMMYVALTYDHRVIDGRDAVSFLARVRDFVEQPDKLLLEL